MDHDTLLPVIPLVLASGAMNTLRTSIERKFSYWVMMTVQARHMLSLYNAPSLSIPSLRTSLCLQTGMVVMMSVTTYSPISPRDCLSGLNYRLPSLGSSINKSQQNQSTKLEDM